MIGRRWIDTRSGSRPSRVPDFISYRIVGLKRLQEAVDLAPGFVADRNAIALRASVDLVEKNAEARMPRGPGHFGYHAFQKFFTRVEIGTGRSLQSRGIVGNTAPQARWGEGGTGAHEIRPKNRQAMLLGGSAGKGVDAVRLVAVVQHPGEKAQHTMRKALTASKGAIRGFFVGATLQVTHMIAGSGD